MDSKDTKGATDADARDEILLERLDELATAAGVDANDLSLAIALDFQRKTWGPGDCGKLMANLDKYRAREMDVPLWRHISSPPAEAFAREVPPGTVVGRRMEKDRANETRK